MKTKELSEKTGLKDRTIRFYEEQGLLIPKMERRNGRNFREYSDEDVLRLTTIATLRRARFTLEEIREMLESGQAIERIYPDYLQRVCREADIAVQLREAAVQISPYGLNSHTLAQRLEQSTKRMSLPSVDIAPHFGKFDTESPEEKRRAIAAYHERQNRKRLTPVQWALSVLSVLCVLLAVGCAAVIGHYKEEPVVPEPSGTTEGWIYYKAYENGTHYVCRYEEANGAVERIYESQENTLAFLVTEEKIYISDGGVICSVNADGTGQFRICKNGYAATNGRMALHDGWIYVTTGLVGHAGQLARVPIGGGKLEEMDVAVLTDFEILEDTLYTDYGGEIILLDLKDLTSREFETGTSPQNVTVQSGVIYEMDLWSPSSDGVTGSLIRVSAYEIVDDELVLKSQWTLDEMADGGRKYVRDGLMYYTVGVRGGTGNSVLYAMNMESGEKKLITEVPAQSYPGIYWGEAGMIVADSVDKPQYILYQG